MGRIDTETKEYVKRPAVFADLFNYLIYGGENVIKPESLSELDTTETFIPLDNTGKAFPTQKYRDILKSAIIMEDGTAAYALILGVENQTDIHYAMPVRTMGYDAYHYAAQVNVIARKSRNDKSTDFLSGFSKKDKLTPVITLVLYFGLTPWDGALSLHEMFKVENKDVLKFIPDYKINLLSPSTMDFKEIEKFSSDFKELAAFLRCGNDKNAMRDLVENNENFRHLDPLVANIANDITKSGLEIKIDEKGEANMCIAMQELCKDWFADGAMEKAKEMATKMIADGLMPIEKIAEYSGLSLEKVKELAREKATL